MGSLERQKEESIVKFCAQRTGLGHALTIDLADGGHGPMLVRERKEHADAWPILRLSIARSGAKFFAR